LSPNKVYLSLEGIVLRKTTKRGGKKMKAIGNILAIIGILLFVYTLVGRFVGDSSIMGFTQVPVLGEGFTAVGMFSGAACIMLISIIALLKSK
jgi:hypothetical protein